MMKNRFYHIAHFIVLFLLVITLDNVLAQEKGNEVRKVFTRIEEGIQNASVDKFASYFSAKNYLSLGNGVSGYFSANQSYYVIEDFLSVYQPINFKINSFVTDSTTPFASGTLKYNSKGIKGTSFVFISLHFVDNQWRISQITIN